MPPLPLLLLSTVPSSARVNRWAVTCMSENMVTKTFVYAQALDLVEGSNLEAYFTILACRGCNFIFWQYILPSTNVWSP